MNENVTSESRSRQRNKGATGRRRGQRGKQDKRMAAGAGERETDPFAGLSEGSGGVGGSTSVGAETGRDDGAKAGERETDPFA